MVKRILVIDDNTSIHNDFRKILMKSKPKNDHLNDMESFLFGAVVQQPPNSALFEIDCASQGIEGLELVKQAIAKGTPYALAFVDIRMPPGWDGIETIRHVWNEYPDIQVVLCTAYSDYSWDEIHRILGETDNLLILKKPFDNIEVLQIAHTLTRKWELNLDIQGRLNKLAFYDNLTGLPNRVLFMDRFTHVLENSHRYKRKGALLFIDLDNFKQINDTMGHNAGDELLKIMSDRIVKCLRISDTITRTPSTDEMSARLGGDEFTVILPEISKYEDAAVTAQRIAEHIIIPMNLCGQEVVITCSIGIAVFPVDGETIESLLKNADLAMYYAKRIGPNHFQYYQESMNTDALKRLTMENHLRHASMRNEFTLVYQPQFNLLTGQFNSMEALLRWNNSELGSISPAEFIPIAEENGLIIPIGEWVIRTACQQIKTWLDKGLFVQCVSVNVSLKQLTQANFVEMVRAILADTNLEAERLEIELTESIMERDISGITSILNALKNMQVRLAIDDFGTGYSCLSRLKDMPIDCLKIDRSFLMDIEDSKANQSIINAIIAMAKKLNLTVIAEGVETKTQLDFLYENNCQKAQGYMLSYPLSALQTEEFLKRLYVENS
ncbi:MAG: EAL domain-containing protein [Desulfobacterales bacterium]|nr:EAL domain-containing protein [Desulfobacterales bacterium]